MKTTTYQHDYKYFEGERKKTYRKLIKWLKKNPNFLGEIKIHSWAAEDNCIDITIKSDDVVVEK